jgi:hypothetical protein
MPRLHSASPKKPILLTGLLSMLPLICLQAQTPEGVITGTVTDPQGAGVSGAQIMARQLSTDSTFKAQSAQDGNYVIPSLPVGKYAVSVSARGFKSFERTDLTLDVDQRLRVDVALEIGSTHETVTVSGDVPKVQTDDSALGNVIESQRIEELPLNGRQPFTLVKLVGGVQSTSNSANGFADSSNQAFSRLRINGGSTLGNQFFLDGAMDTVPAINEISVVPLADSIAEFRVQTNTLPAEFGQTSGGVVNLATKSGGNEVHGTAYEFDRNDALNARNAFATQPDPNSGRLKPILRYNQFGGTIGGPVVIPKLYKGTNRTFFFFGYEQWHYRSASVMRTTVPTALQRNGDFSQTRDSTGKVIPIYDPAGTVPNPHGNGYVRTLFQGNVVPPSRVDPLSLSVLKYMPLPNATPPTAANLLTNSNNYLAEVPSPIDQDVIAIRIDHRFNNSDSAWIRYAGNLNSTKTEGYGLGAADPQARNDYRENHNLAVAETHIFSPSLLNEFRASVTRQYLTFVAPSVGGDWPSKLGYPSILPQDEFPAVLISGDLGLGYSVSGSPSDGDRAQFTIQLADSMTWVKGRHTIKFGVDHRITRLNYLSQSYPSGEFSFNTDLTGNPQSPAGTGIGMATFLLGEVSSGQQTYNPAFAYKTWSEGLYVQDDFKATKRLTLNLGLRYDISGPPTERYNRYSNFIPSAINPQTGRPGELVYAGVTAPTTFVNYDYNNFGPRFGFAYVLTSDNRTVVRGGYAVVYNPVESGDIHGNGSNALGFSTSTQFAENGPFAPFLFSGGPSVLIQPVGPAGGPSAFMGQGVTFQDPHAPVPYAGQWNFTFQREFAGWSLATSYVGNHGVKLFGGNYNLNQLNPIYFSTYGTLLQNQVPNPFYGVITSGSLSGKTISQSQALLQFPNYTSINTLANHGADSIYHSMQVTLEHRYAHGITALASYTWSKLIDDSASNDSGESVQGAFRLGAYNRALDRSVDESDVPHHLVVSGFWQLPFAAQSHGWIKQVANGWQLNGIITWQSGFPLSITGANNFTGINYPNVLFDPTLPASERNSSHWFSTSAFANPAPYTVGDAPRTLPYLRGPGLANADVSVAKHFAITERWDLEFRAEAFNALNHVNYNNPNTSFSPNGQGANTNSTFGEITSALDARALQLGLHLSW